MHYGPQYGYGYAFPHPPPPDPPERPAGIAGDPRWPAWYGPAAFGTGIVGTAIFGTLIVAIVGSKGTTAGVILTVALDAVFVASALMFASMTERPRPVHFGLRRAPFWRTLGWAALGMVCFWIVSGTYSTLVKSHGKQTVLQDLHARDSTATLIAAAVLVIVIAPAAEEFFFRGFFYRALRTRMGVLVAALLDGILFGAIHYSGTNTAALLPILAVLGFIFCLVYERTGTLFATIGLHALNNTIAYGVGTHKWAVAGSIGGTMLTACLVLPLLLGARAAPARA